MSLPPVVAVVGPTAAGKSDLAVHLARALGGEVVNGDSMQVYRGMDIGTAKLSEEERRGIPHHLLDRLDVTQPATVAEFQGWAREAIADCRHRDIVPVLVGGSALYLRAVLDDFEFPGTDAAVRARLEVELAERGSLALHERLREVDPDAATAILSSNGRRIVRALEVVEITGRPYRATLPEHRYAVEPVVQVGLDVPRDVLDQRIATRVDRMWQAGLLDGSTPARVPRPPRRPHRLPRARLRPGAPVPRGRVHRGGGPRGHHPRHPEVRAPAGHLVQA